jgi:hypothetical protein
MTTLFDIRAANSGPALRHRTYVGIQFNISTVRGVRFHTHEAVLQADLRQRLGHIKERIIDHLDDLNQFSPGAHFTLEIQVYDQVFNRNDVAGLDRFMEECGLLQDVVNLTTMPEVQEWLNEARLEFAEFFMRR